MRRRASCFWLVLLQQQWQRRKEQRGPPLNIAIDQLKSQFSCIAFTPHCQACRKRSVPLHQRQELTACENVVQPVGRRQGLREDKSAVPTFSYWILTKKKSQNISLSVCIAIHLAFTAQPLLRAHACRKAPQTAHVSFSQTRCADS